MKKLTYSRFGHENIYVIHRNYLALIQQKSFKMTEFCMEWNITSDTKTNADLSDDLYYNCLYNS